ncbi:MAG: hypothetical protein JW943_15745 [Deltaproteobacteria bacterium]|nr:hypothetical protein [Deltaproteobacteria bacterium]
MRIFKYWQRARGEVLIDGKEKSISCYGGSNHSESDALADGHRRLEAVKRRIAGIDKERPPDYEGDIREELIESIGSEDAITRNRYGAEVLNSTSCVFVDIDEPVFRLWQIFRRFRSTAQKKQAILEFLERRLRKPDLNGFGIRIYETHNGVRLLLTGKAMNPRSPESRKLLRSFNADFLYATLCRKQNCYRARLTPKPHRIKMKPIRLKYPYEENDRERIDAWVGEYNSRCEAFATCRLVKKAGVDFDSLAVRCHDGRTKAQSNLPLA